MLKKQLIFTFSACILLSFYSVYGKSLRVYLMGNSLTDNIDHEGLIQLAESRGHNHTHGSHRIPGTPMDWLYGHPTSGFNHRPYGYWGHAFGNYQWDAVSVQPFLRPLSSDIETSSKFMDTAKVLSPDVQFYIYAQWPKEGFGDYAQLWLRNVWPWIANGTSVGPKPERTKMYYETLVDTLRKLRPDMKPAKIAPVGHVFYLLDQKIKAGLVPGHSSIWEFVTGTHVNNVGSYIAGVTYFATFYHENPVGLPVVEPYQPESGSKYDLPINSELAKIIQESVWEVVATHPQTGVSATEPVKIVSPIIEDAIENNAYNFVFMPAFGQHPYSWSVVSGSLPNGLALSASGKITGSTSEVGTHTFTVKVTDANGASAQKQFSLKVVTDTKPTITTTSPLPNVGLAEYFKLQFEATGGNGDISWEFVDESYPPGVELGLAGELKGAIGKKGEYTFTIRAFDRDATTPDTALKAFSLHVGEPVSEIIYAPRIATLQRNPEDDVEGDDHLEPTLDGVLDEDCWKLTTEAKKVVEGTTHNNNVTFDAAWTDGFKGDLWIAVNVRDASVTSDDRVVVYIDALNNREDTYNWDDRRIVVSPETGDLVKEECIGSLNRIGGKATKTNDGYTVEVMIDWRNIDLKNEDMLNRVLGIDIANIDVDDAGGEQTQVVWQGTARNNIEPSEFGSVIFVDDGATNMSNTIDSNKGQLQNILVYQNTKGRFRVKLPYKTSWDITLFRLDGKTVYSKRVHTSGTVPLLHVPTTTNVYLIRIQSIHGTSIQKVLVR